MSVEDQEDSSIGQRLKAEMREYAIISVYLWVCFSTMLLYQDAMLSEGGSSVLPLSMAVIKALVLGKFILIGKAVGVGTRVQPKILLYRILWKSLAFLFLLMVFTGIEELVVGLVHGHSVGEIVAEVTGRPLLKKVASSILMLLVLIPLIAFEEIDRALGNNTLRRMLFGRSESR
jgi:hypothetical protein